MSKIVTLADGSEVLIRPVTPDDRDASLTFFRSLPEEDRVYLRTDVTRPEMIDRRFARIEAGLLRVLVATDGHRILADGALEVEGREWKNHLAEMRLFVAPSHRCRGLGVQMSREVYGLALSKRVEEIVVRVMKPQAAARSVIERLGFHEHAVLKDYVLDQSGRKQDLIVLRCDVNELWRKIEEHTVASDWQRTR
jgi:L-amino acid N-acyltransferase YncA